ncbi:Lrp/AsnC family transcriptional regulator [Sphingomonas japonica]|uniref:DNA-binding Lrp family transcriptional regulator n=1 Tax=Sphingomonas japonica TaxID=511662 RepID=A0ABX0U6U1_9SPHN|nr:Lrp/AsnC family transcriptional regulator [Sphingomonas japonica]NIJ25042.1 DNA-binding Lrp family transcriptional regulator [Sphingomonas japonica]
MQTDRIDRAILKLLSGDARMAISTVAERVGLSQSACSRRVQALEGAGLILGYSACVDRKRLGFHVTALVDITLSTQVEEDLAAFERAVARIDGIVACALISGNQDYRLTIICRDLDDYERLHREHLGRLPGVTTIASSFVLRDVATRGEADALFAA